MGAEPLPVDYIRIPEGQRGWDWRRILGRWAAGVRRIEVWDPYLHRPDQREILAHLLDVASTLNVGRVDLYTWFTNSNAVPDLDTQQATASALDSMVRHFAAAGLDMAVHNGAFHRRRIYLVGAETYELWLDRGLHAWQPPRSQAERVSLACRRTQEQDVAVLRHADGPPEVLQPAAAAAPSAAEWACSPSRCRRLLHEIALLKGRSHLDTRQLAKLAREGPLRQALAALSRRRLAPWSPVVGDGACPNPLCGLLVFAGRVACLHCRLCRPEVLDAGILNFWSARVRRAWLRAARLIQRAVRRWARRPRAATGTAGTAPARGGAGQLGRRGRARRPQTATHGHQPHGRQQEQRQQHGHGSSGTRHGYQQGQQQQHRHSSSTRGQQLQPPAPPHRHPFSNSIFAPIEPRKMLTTKWMALDRPISL